MPARMIKIMMVEAPAARYRPPPTARPIAATVQMLAAVVRPFTISPRARMAPAPRKPIPETTCAAIRDGSSTICSYVRMLENPYCETIMIRQDPTHTSICVRMPAAHSSRSRSNPIMLPSTAAPIRRISISVLDISHLRRSEDISRWFGMPQWPHRRQSSAWPRKLRPLRDFKGGMPDFPACQHAGDRELPSETRQGLVQRDGFWPREESVSRDWPPLPLRELSDADFRGRRA